MSDGHETLDNVGAACSRDGHVTGFVTLTLALLAWVVPLAHATPTDAHGPSGLFDNADFDDLILSVPVVIAAACPIAVDAVGRGPSRVRPVVRSSIRSRAPPLS